MRYGRPLVPPQPLAVMDVRTGRITTPFTAARPGVRAAGVEPRLAHARHLRRQPRGARPARIPCHGRARHHSRSRTRASRGTSATGWPTATSTGSPTSAGAASPAPVRSPALLRQHVDQTPGRRRRADVLAVPATTVTVAGGPAPIMIVVVYDRRGRAVGEWDTGAVADSIALLGGGRVITASRRAGLVLDDRLTGEVITSAARRPIIAAAVSPDRVDARALERAATSCSRTWPDGRAGRCPATPAGCSGRRRGAYATLSGSTV